MGAPQACVCEKPQRVGASEHTADTCAIIVAGGLGVRFGDPQGKQFVELCGLPLMCWSLMAFDQASSVAQLVVVCPAKRLTDIKQEVLAQISLSKPVTLAPAGVTRQESVFSGLSVMDTELAFTAVHDAARPLIETEMIEYVISEVRTEPALSGAILAAHATDTLKVVEGTTIAATPDRNLYWAAQTPQVFRTEALYEAHERARNEDYQGTDDSSLVEHYDGQVRVVENPRNNLKVTVPGDLELAEAVLMQRLVDAGTQDFDPDTKKGGRPCA